MLRKTAWIALTDLSLDAGPGLFKMLTGDGGSNEPAGTIKAYFGSPLPGQRC